MLKLPELIQELSEKGCTDAEAMEIATELMKIELLKKCFNQSTLDKIKLDGVINAVKDPSDREKAIFRFLGDFSQRERQCFLMHTVQNISMGKIAEELNISKGTVQKYIERAREKITSVA
ncbi:sigma factor-like helix-turn-helix DNA-binding protein [Pseudogracilibacillus auburnensis]|uniref:sigma factor-like helix-turn-helix DNA-binding protein n=1 Tax=Pseudogracilibacillus auburnensis TaxID=1494959 RepID=UPI001F6245E2|nr:sigma factor-like helix-turn-helix DNA-binding protein [Pseudogracilibacillus auburnensis]